MGSLSSLELRLRFVHSSIASRCPSTEPQQVSGAVGDPSSPNSFPRAFVCYMGLWGAVHTSQEVWCSGMVALGD